MPTKKKPEVKEQRPYLEPGEAGGETAASLEAAFTPDAPANLPAIAKSAPAPAIVPASVELDRYHGASAIPVALQTQEILMAPIDPNDVEIRPDPGDGILYLPEIKYRKTLSRAFSPMGWALVPLDPQPNLDDNNVMTQQWALYINGRFAAQARGQQKYHPNSGDNQTYADAQEGCKSNALMRCCKDLSIASELWDPNFINQWISERAVQVWRKPKAGQQTRRPEWRRADRPEFWDETGIVGQAKQQPAQQAAPKQQANPTGQVPRDSDGNQMPPYENGGPGKTIATGPQHEKLKGIIEAHIKKMKMAPDRFGSILQSLTKGIEKGFPNGADKLEACTLKMVVMGQGEYARREEEAKKKKAQQGK